MPTITALSRLSTSNQTSLSRCKSQRRQVAQLPGNKVEVNGYVFNLNESSELHEFRVEGVAAIRTFADKLQGPIFAYLVTADMYGLETPASFARLEAASIAFAEKYKMPETSVSSLKRYTQEIADLGIIRIQLVDYERRRLSRRKDFRHAHPGHTQIHQFEFSEVMLHKKAEIAAAEREREMDTRRVRRAELEHARYERRKAALEAIPHETDLVTDPLTEPVSEPRIPYGINPCGDNRPERSASSSCDVAHHDDGEAPPSSQSQPPETGQQDGQPSGSGGVIECPRHEDAQDDCQACEDYVVRALGEWLNTEYHFGLDDPGLRKVVNQIGVSRVDRFFDQENPMVDRLLSAITGAMNIRVSMAALFVRLLPDRVAAWQAMTPDELEDLARQQQKAEEARQERARELACRSRHQADIATQEAEKARKYEQQLREMREEYVVVYGNTEEFNYWFDFWSHCVGRNGITRKQLLQQLRLDLEKKRDADRELVAA